MIEPTGQNFRKAWVIADFLNRIGYFSWNFFDADGVMEMCRDEAELCWWYQKCMKFGKGRIK